MRIQPRGRINRLDRFDLLILDDLAYVTKDQAETSVLFELISARARAAPPGAFARDRWFW